MINSSFVTNRQPKSTCSGKSSPSQNRSCSKDLKYSIAGERLKANTYLTLLTSSRSTMIGYAETQCTCLSSSSIPLSHSIMRLFIGFQILRPLTGAQQAECRHYIFKNINFGVFCTVAPWAWRLFVRVI